MDAPYLYSQPNVIHQGEVASYGAQESLNMITSLRIFGDLRFLPNKSSQKKLKKNIRYYASTTSPRVYMEDNSRLWCPCSYSYPFYKIGSVSTMSRFYLSSQCQGHDSLAYVNGNLNDSIERSGEEVVEPPGLDELRGKQQMGLKDLEVAGCDQTMVVENAKKTSESVIALKPEAMNTWDSVNTSAKEVVECCEGRASNYKNYPIIHPIDSDTFGEWLQSCSTIEEIRKFHALAIKSEVNAEVFVSNNLISRYVKFGDLVSALRVFRCMSERNVVSWTAMINGYQRNGLDNEALRLFADFVESGFDGNLKTFSCMFSLCSRVFDYELGRQLHACIIKSGMSSLILSSAILHFYAQCGDLDGVVHTFDRMQKQDVVSWTTMITACSQYGWEENALVMFSRMLSDGLRPNEFTVSSTLNACGEEKVLKFGRQLHGMAVKNAYDMDVYVGTSLVDMYAKCGEIEDSRALFDGMSRKNAITWTSIISGYARNGLGEEAISLYRVMDRLKLFSNDITVVSVLQACGSLRALSTGKEVHAHSLKKFSPSNIFVGSALVWLYCKCGDYSSSSKVLHYMPKKDVVSWTAFISGCSGLGYEYEALEYLKKMLGEGVEPNSYTYSSALKACAKLENIEQGRLIHSSLNKTPASSNVFVGSALVHMYSKCGYLPEAIQVFNGMPEKNLVSWKSMIVAYAKNGLCGEALKLMYQMKAEGIEVDDYILSTVLSACGDFEWSKESSLAHCL